MSAPHRLIEWDLAYSARPGHLADSRVAGTPPPDCLTPTANIGAFKTIPTRPTTFTTKPASARHPAGQAARVPSDVATGVTSPIRLPSRQIQARWWSRGRLAASIDILRGERRAPDRLQEHFARIGLTSAHRRECLMRASQSF